MILRGNRGDSVLAKVETSFGDRLFRFPVGDAEVTVFMFIRFLAGGDKAKMLGPAQGHVVEREFGGVPVVGEPAFAFAHKEHGVSGIFDDVAPIAKTQSKGCARRKRIGEEDTEGILAAVTQFLGSEALVLEKSERSAGIQGNRCDLEGACKLKEKELRGACKRAKIDGGISIEGVVGVEGGVDVVTQGSEVRRRERKTGERVGGPNVVRGNFVNGAWLPDHEIFRAHLVNENVKRAGDYAIDSRMEEMPVSGGKFFEEDAEGVRGIKARDIGFPSSDKSGAG